jgi:hypothetical protein
MDPPELEINGRGHHGLPQIPRAGGQSVLAPPEYRRAGCPDTLRVGACQDLVAMGAALPEVMLAGEGQAAVSSQRHIPESWARLKL